MMNNTLASTGQNGCRSHVVAAGVLILCLVLFYFSFLLGGSYIWDDLLFVHYPGSNYLATAIREGHFSFWLSGVRNGVPFYTDFGMQVFYPPNWLLVFFVTNGKLSVLAYQWYLVVQYFLAGYFVFLFLKESRFQFWAAIAGMISFVFSAFMSLHIIHAGALSAVLWLPLELYCVKKIFNGAGRVGSFILLILGILMSFLAGFPQVVMYSAYFLSAYWLYMYWVTVRPEHPSIRQRGAGVIVELVKIGSVYVVALLLGAALFMPAAENWYNSDRQTFGFSQISDLSLPFYYLIHGLIPNFFGAQAEGGGGIPFWGFNKDTLEYQTWRAGAWMYWEFGFYAGQLALIAIAVLVFNIRRCWRQQREIMFFLVALPVVTVLMLGRYGGLFNLLYHVAPGFSMFRTPARIGCLFDMCAAVLAAGLVNMLLAGKPVLNLKHPLLVLSGAYVAFFCWIGFSGPTHFPELADERLMRYALKQTVWSIVVFAGSAILLIALRKSAPRGDDEQDLGKPKWLTYALAAGLAVLLFIDLAVAFHGFHGGRTNPSDYYADRNGLISQMLNLRDQAGPFRFAQLRDAKMSEEIVFPRNIGYFYPGYEALEGYLLFGLKGWSGFNSITNERVKLDIENVGLTANLDVASRRVNLGRYTNSLPRAKFYHDVRVYADVKSLYADLDAGKLDYYQTAGLLREDCEKYGLKMFSSPANAKAQVHFTPKDSDEYQISYQTTAPGIIFVSENFYPGWQATVGGKRLEVIRTFGAFKGIVVPEAGSGVITVKFSPWIFKLGLAVSLTTLFVLSGVWLWDWRRRQRGQLLGC